MGIKRGREEMEPQNNPDFFAGHGKNITMYAHT